MDQQTGRPRADSVARVALQCRRYSKLAEIVVPEIQDSQEAHSQDLIVAMQQIAADTGIETRPRSNTLREVTRQDAYAIYAAVL